MADKWDQRPGREPDDTWNYDHAQAAETRPSASRPTHCIDCGKRLTRQTIQAHYHRCPPCRDAWWKSLDCALAEPDEQPTVVHPAVLKRCRGPQCGALLYRGAARDFCEPCERLWKLRNAVARGELSDWIVAPDTAGMHHIVGLGLQPVFGWASDFDDAVWKAMWDPYFWVDTTDEQED